MADILSPEDALRSAAGLCESEANRWSHDDKTSHHWRAVAVQLRAQLLIVQVEGMRKLQPAIRDTDICGECGHGAAMHEWETENHSCCLAAVDGSFGTKNRAPCMCMGFKPSTQSAEMKG